jgi:hypothetical protein
LYNSSKRILGLGGIVNPIPKKYSRHLDRSGTGLEKINGVFNPHERVWRCTN